MKNYQYVLKQEKLLNDYIFRFSNKSDPLIIEDTGRIFDRFYTKDKSRNNKTTGLGLAIAKEVTKK